MNANEKLNKLVNSERMTGELVSFLYSIGNSAHKQHIFGDKNYTSSTLFDNDDKHTKIQAVFTLVRKLNLWYFFFSIPFTIYLTTGEATL